MLCMTESLKWNISRSMQAGGSLQEETAELQKQSGLSKGKLLALAFAGAQGVFSKENADDR